MERVFKLTQDIRDIATQAFDDCITEFSKTCTLVYPPKLVDCPNCIYDPIGKKSSNHYQAGGPVQFSFGLCPVCGGQGKREESVSEQIQLNLYWTPKQWKELAQRVVVPENVFLIKGFMSDYPKVQKCQYLLIQNNLANNIEFKAVKYGEPIDIYNIVQARYFCQFWQRA